jgi:glycosyltransferase involved in cell wall biosynthesis
MSQPIGLNWQLSSYSGWGGLGLHLALRLLATGRALPVPVHRPDLSLGPVERRLIQPALEAHAMLAAKLAPAQAADPAAVFTLSIPIIHALGNDFVYHGRLRGTTNLGLIFFENTAFSPAGLARGRAFDLMVAGSRWNAARLEALGIANVRMCWQGIDPTVFHPAPRAGFLADRFVVFSGGKLEHRKGQDIALVAFRAFQQRHPEALLLTAWHSPWPATAATITRGGLVDAPPPVGPDGRLDVAAWAAAQGVPAGALVDVGFVPNREFGKIVREADVAIFPNRCEGGTNVVAMEALACGVPCIIADNTGQRDLVAEVACYPLTDQRPVPSLGPGDGTDDWGESSVEELVEALEHVYQHRDEARAVGRRAAEQMLAWSWQRRLDELIAVLAPAALGQAA